MGMGRSKRSHSANTVGSIGCVDFVAGVEPDPGSAVVTWYGRIATLLQDCHDLRQIALFEYDIEIAVRSRLRAEAGVDCPPPPVEPHANRKRVHQVEEPADIVGSHLGRFRRAGHCRAPPPRIVNERVQERRRASQPLP
jgi:hypothetical protein